MCVTSITSNLNTECYRITSQRMLGEEKTKEAKVMKNTSVKSTQTEQLEKWLTMLLSLSASLVFGKDKASQISQPLLIAIIYVDFE